MFTLKVENPSKATLSLTQNESRYQIAEISGLNPPKATINTTTIAGMDGARYKSSKLAVRNIVLKIAINGEVEKNRLDLYDFFGTGRWCKLYYTNDSRDVFCEGYCETFDGSLFAKKQTMQISIICPEPYFKSFQLIQSDISKEFANFEFPFAIAESGKEFSIIDAHREAQVFNSGEVACGVIIRIRSELDGINNPVIRNVETGEYLGFNITLDLGDILEINTNKGHKSVLKYINGIPENAINSLMKGSTWFQLSPGLNKFFYESDENPMALKIEFDYNLLYEGV
jgi:hypothetical protein